jgi:predicted ATP-grasp superfamily ATP-dependent carboligase
VAFLIGPAGLQALQPATQLLSENGRFQFQGGTLPLEHDLAQRAVRLGSQAVRTVEGMFGYVGVDLVLGADGEGDHVIEINPRFTTSYVGLRALAKDNLMEALLRIATGAAPNELAWRPGPVRFWPDGRVISQSGTG